MKSPRSTTTSNGGFVCGEIRAGGKVAHAGSSYSSVTGVSFTSHLAAYPPVPAIPAREPVPTTTSWLTTRKDTALPRRQGHFLESSVDASFSDKI